jgi:hypothetical protein
MDRPSTCSTVGSGVEVEVDFVGAGKESRPAVFFGAWLVEFER